MQLHSDLSLYHEPIGNLFPNLESIDWEKLRLSEDQVQQFNELGYVSGIKLLEDKPVEELKNELIEIMEPQHPKHHLLYEFHTNESEDPDRIVFHSLSWRYAIIIVPTPQRSPCKELPGTI